MTELEIKKLNNLPSGFDLEAFNRAAKMAIIVAMIPSNPRIDPEILEALSIQLRAAFEHDRDH